MQRVVCGGVELMGSSLSKNLIGPMPVPALLSTTSGLINIFWNNLKSNWLFSRVVNSTSKVYWTTSLKVYSCGLATKHGKNGSP